MCYISRKTLRIFTGIGLEMIAQ